MQKTKPTKTFKEEYEHKAKLKAINECSWFGIIWGLVIAAAGVYQAICTIGVINIIWKVVSALGVVLLVVACFAPLWLQKVTETIKKIFSVFGNVVLKVILLPVYFVMIIINTFTNKKYSAKFGFKNWEERHSATTAFGDFNHSGQNKHTSLGTVIRVMSFFVYNKMYVVLPIVVILLIVGAIMFFASSSAVFSFVYTLF